MTYDPEQKTPINAIRRKAGDTSNDPATELMTDADYLFALDEFGVSNAPGTSLKTAAFYRAAADIFLSLAARIDQLITSASSQSDGSVGWSPNRARTLTGWAAEYAAEADRLDAESSDSFWGPTVTVRGNFLTGSVHGGAEW